MADDATVFRFPTVLREVPSITTAHTFHPQAPAGLHDFPTRSPRVDQDGHRILIDGVHARTFMNWSNASRSAEALSVLAELGWPIERLAARDGIEPEPQPAA